MRENDLSKIIYDSAIEVHKTLGGPGLLEGVYEEALAWELHNHGLAVERQLVVPVIYKGCTLSTPLRLDLLVNKLVIIEVKAVAEYNSLFEAQALTYLRLMHLKLALVINFGSQYVSKGFHRVANNL